MDLWQDIDASIDLAEQLELQHRKDERMSYCGRSVAVIELPSGGRKLIYWYCKDPRCEICNERKGSVYKARIRKLVDAGEPIQFIQLPSSLSGRFCKRLKKENYLRIPNGKLDDIFYLEKSANPEEYITGSDLDEYDWTSKVKRIGNRIISGGLGKDPLEDKPQHRYTVEVMDIVAYPKEDVIKSILEAATSVIAWREPSSIQESQEYRNVFNSKLIERLTMNSCKILSIIRHEMGVDTFDTSFIELKKLF
jgi:hypothetical protein